MITSLIVAVSQNGVIGSKGGIPWHLPDDFAYFKALTRGHCVVMGRATYESIGHPLPLRTNIVLSRSKAFTAPGCTALRTFDQARTFAQTAGETELFVIGGQMIYYIALLYAQKIYLTRVHADIKGDRFFPPFPHTQWSLTQSVFHPSDSRHAYSFTFETYERVNPT